MIKDPKVIENDALVVLCLQQGGHMTHHEFKVRAAARGISLTKSQCHNLLHRAMGRVITHNNKWYLTSMGAAYREEVLATMHRLLGMEVGGAI